MRDMSGTTLSDSAPPHLLTSKPPPTPWPQERSIVSDMSGTTRDAIDTDVTLKDGRK